MSAPLVLLHGFLGGPHSFGAVLESVVRTGGSRPVFCPTIMGHDRDGVDFGAAPLLPMSGHDALAFATPGHDTDPNRDFLNEIERISALIHQVHGEPVTLGGYSMGGRLALGLALRHPEQVCRLVLISSRRGLDTEEERLARRASDERWARLAESLGLEEFLDRWWEAPLFASLKAVPEERLSVERANRSGLSPDGIIWALRRLGLGRQPSYAQEIASLQPPATLIVGGLDDKFRALNEELARQLPRARLLVVKDHGHSLPLEAPEAVGRAIAEED